MKIVVTRVFGLLLLLSGLVSALLLRALPPSHPLFWGFPVVLLVGGCLLSARDSSLRQIMVLSVVTAIGFLTLWLQSGEMSTAGVAAGGAGQSIRMEKVVLNVPAQMRRGGFSQDASLLVYPGLKISLFAEGLQQPRMLAFSPAGDLYVSLPGAGQVAILPDRNHDGIADEISVFADRLDQPHGLVFSGDALYVAENGRLIRLHDRDGDLKADLVEVVSADLPAGGGHWTRSVETGADGAFYVAAGSSCNACEEVDPRRAAILRIEKSGGSAVIFARGLRNSVGLARHPETGELWASNNGRDMLGDDLPPEELNRIIAGGDYGWPYCYGQRIPDPDLGSPERCRETLPPIVEMQAHSAPLGIAFGQGLKFPVMLQNMLFVAFHGSWNRSTPTGYKLIGIPFAEGRPSGPPQDIVSGWLQGYSAWGRPVAPIAGPDGALYLSDDRAGAIYRISARKE